MQFVFPNLKPSQPDDAILVIAEDDDSYAPGALPAVTDTHLPSNFAVRKEPEKILFCGWRRDMDDMIVVGALRGVWV